MSPNLCIFCCSMLYHSHLEKRQSTLLKNPGPFREKGKRIKLEQCFLRMDNTAEVWVLTPRRPLDEQQSGNQIPTDYVKVALEALADAVDHPVDGVRVLEVPEIRRAPRKVAEPLP